MKNSGDAAAFRGELVRWRHGYILFQNTVRGEKPLGPSLWIDHNPAGRRDNSIACRLLRADGQCHGQPNARAPTGRGVDLAVVGRRGDFVHDRWSTGRQVPPQEQARSSARAAFRCAPHCALQSHDHRPDAFKLCLRRLPSPKTLPCHTGIRDITGEATREVDFIHSYSGMLGSIAAAGTASRRTDASPKWNHLSVCHNDVHPSRAAQSSWLIHRNTGRRLLSGLLVTHA